MNELSADPLLGITSHCVNS